MPPDSPPQSWLRRRIINPVLGLLKQGLTPTQLALTVALGTVIGTIPLLGTTTLLATFVALRLRLNVPAMHTVCLLLSPLQLLLLVPLLARGAGLLGGPAQPNLSVAGIRHLISTDWRAALSLLWRAELGALAIWLLAGVPLGLLLYFGLKPVLRRVLARQAAEGD